MRIPPMEVEHSILPESSEVTIELEGWQRCVKDRVDAGESVGKVWARISHIDGDLVHLQEGKPSSTGGADGLLDCLVTHFPLGVCTLLLVPCFPLGFACGLSTEWSLVVPVFVFPFVFVFTGCLCVAFERALVLWAIAVWAAWTYMLLTPFMVLVYFYCGQYPDKMLHATALNMAFMIVTMPMYITAMKVYNFEWGARYEIIKLLRIILQMVLTVALFVVFVMADWVLLNAPWSDPRITHIHRALRPFTVFLAKRTGYMVVMDGLSRHPSVTFRVMWLFSTHTLLNVVGVGAMCKSKTWKDALYFLTVDTVLKLSGVYCFTLSGTEALRGSRVLQLIHTVLSKGKPVPFPGMVKIQYRAIEIFAQTASMISVLVGLIITYFATRLLPFERYQVPILFWYPNGFYSLTFLCILMVREVVYEAIMHKVAVYKTNVDYRSVFSLWLRGDSMIGWRQFLLAGLVCSFYPAFLTNSAAGLKVLAQR